MYLYVYKFLPSTHVEGPGERACIYVQGCSIGCEGCITPQSWQKRINQKVNVKTIAKTILQGPEIEGVTFSGGEPFEQAKALAKLGNILQKEGLSIITFTGHVLENIVESSNADWHELLCVTDLLIDGPYMKDKFDLKRPWVGSSNQRYHFLTKRYQHIQSHINEIPNKIEIRLGNAGEIIVNGIIRPENIKDLLDGI
jgi:anaerobic ribonucleoside-triphosphate reductase activating protein